MNPISICMITRGDSHIEQCLRSVWDYVSEICVVITSTNDDDWQLMKRLQAESPCPLTFESFTFCNDGYDKIMDFSMARNRSLELATQPWIMWLDSDDIVVGAEHLAELCSQPMPPNMDSITYMLPYEYSYDQYGKCNLRHFRERLVYNKELYSFLNPVHECLVPKSNKCSLIQNEQVVIKHQRQYSGKPGDPTRNLRILKHYFDQGGKDPRNMYYIGLEYANNNDIPNAVKYLTEYIQISGWEDEKAFAIIRLLELYMAMADYKTALNLSFDLLKLKHKWIEAYYNICRCYYFLQDWDKCAHYANLAAQCPPTQTVLFADPTIQSHLHTYFNVALNHIGQVQQAYLSTLEGLKGLPDNANLLHNKLMYERALNIQIPKLKIDGIVLVTAGMEEWTPDSVKVSGIGGSETMLMNMAKELVSLGNEVHVYANGEGVFDGVHYHHHKDFHHIECQTLIVSRYAFFLSEDLHVDAKLKLLWVHDVCVASATNALLLKADKILALTQWHKNNIVAAHQVHPDQVIVTRNAVDLTRFIEVPTETVRDQYKCVNSSSPDRSWPVLLAIWPEIKKQVPQATLHLYYGFANWRKVAVNDPLQMDLINRLEQQIKDTEGVFFHDRISQEELAKEFLSAGVWLYPTWFSETSCISAMEAQCADLWIITSPIAGLAETCAGYDKTIFIEGEWTSDAYKQKFIEQTINILRK